MADTIQTTIAKVTEQDLLTVLNNGVKGATFCTIKTVTVQDMNKTNNPYYDKVLKHSEINGIIGFDYEANVNKLAMLEGKEKREAKPRKWGVVSPCSRFVFHKGAVYLRFRVNKCLSEPVYMVDGQEISKDLLTPFLREKTKSSTQADLQGEIIERDFSLASINVIVFNHVMYLVDHTIPATAPVIEVTTVETVPVKNPEKVTGWEFVD